MNRKNNKRKGFTIVELVIVIAVIGILAGVLIPTFGSVVENANQTAADQEAKNILTSYLAKHATEGNVKGGIIVDEKYYYTVEDNSITNMDGDNDTDAQKTAYNALPGTGKCYAKAATDGIYLIGAHDGTAEKECTNCGKKN